jgi:3-oxoacyl-(acyl-carrier-protein) synthase
MTNVYVTGIGIISSIGISVNDNLISLKNEKSGLSKLSIFESIFKDNMLVGEIKKSNEDLKKIAEINNDNSFSRTSLLGIIAVKEALKNANINDFEKYKTGLISGTSVGGMLSSEDYFIDILLNKNKGKLSQIISHECGTSTEEIADTINFKGYISTLSTACSSSANAILLGTRLIKNRILDRVIVGGTDSLCRFTINGFNSLLIIDKTECKPFDKDRKGLCLGEGAGFLILESEKSVHESKKNPICKLTGYGNACDAFHQTASSPEGDGAYLAMKKALEKSRLESKDINYINAHGTGTVNNDLSEGKAIERIFVPNIPLVSSTKSYTGHTLGASGGIEAVFSVLSIKEKIIFPNLGFKNKMNELSFSPNTKVILNHKLKHVLSNSFGFGGNNTSLIFSEC